MRSLFFMKHGESQPPAHARLDVLDHHHGGNIGGPAVRRNHRLNKLEARSQSILRMIRRSGGRGAGSEDGLQVPSICPGPPRMRSRAPAEAPTYPWIRSRSRCESPMKVTSYLPIEIVVWRVRSSYSRARHTVPRGMTCRADHHLARVKAVV